MKNQLRFLALALISSTFCIAQNYQALKPQSEAWYVNHFSEVWPITVSADGITGNIFHYKAYDAVYDTANLFSGWGEECFDYQAGLLGGKRVDVSADAGSHFYNYKGDTIYFPGNLKLGSTWTLMHPLPHVIIKGNITARNLQNILSTSDSVYIINLQMTTTTGQSINHPINGKEIWLSKNYGLIRSYNFYVFPKDTTQWNLIGFENQTVMMGKTKLNRDKIFNFTAGDVFHAVTKDIGVIITPDTTYFGNGTIIHRMRTVNTRVDYPDSVVYQYADCQRTITFLNSVPDTAFFQGNITEGYSLMVQPQTTLDAQPLEAIPYNYGGFNGYYDIRLSQLSNNRLEKTIVSDLFSFWNTPDCLTYSMFDPCCASDSYIEGCGGPYYYQDNWFTGVNEHKLLYYKKGNETWGTPIAPSCESLINGISSTLKPVAMFHLSPNPAGDNTTLFSETNSSYTVAIYSTNGKLLKTIKHHGQNLTLYKKNFGNGMFIIKIQTLNGMTEIKKLIFN
jgi:hypothetical protein